MTAAFNILGYGFLDLPNDFEVSFTKKNILYSFDSVELNRTTAFTIPATANNNRLLGFANMPVQYGLMARRRLDAQMQCDGATVTGYFYVTSATPTEYNCCFVLFFGIYFLNLQLILKI